jgi:hypothetical protein
VQLADDLVLVFVKNLGIVDFLEVVEVGLSLVGNAVVYEASTSLKVLDHRWWNILNAMLITEIFLLTLDVKVTNFSSLDCWVHITRIGLIDQI